MRKRPKNQTLCTVCQRMVGAAPNWARWQSGQHPEWRVTRHRRTERRLRQGKQDICPGGGILIPPSAIITEVSA